MNLWNCNIAYFVVSDRALDLSAKIPLLSALEVYKRNSTDILTDSLGGSRYQSRKMRETRHKLVQKGILSESLELLPIPPEHRIVLPRDLDYSSLIFGTLKTLLTCYSRTRYEREHFRFTMRQSHLAKNAGLSRERLGRSLRALQDRALIETAKIWKQGTRVTLLDPEMPSGCPLWYLADHYERRRNDIPVHDKYKTCLGQYDPRGSLQHSNGAVLNYPVHCPFCKHKSPKPSMRINTAEDNDFWYCYACKRKGNSDRLFARMVWRIGKADWRQDLKEVEQATVDEMENSEV